MIDPTLLTTYLAVAELEHFRRASDRLGVAQSVVSKRVARLEDLLGARLFTRGARSRVEPTRIGSLFVAQAQEALSALATIERIGHNLARGRSGPLRIGYVFSAALAGLLPRLLALLTGNFPELQLIPRLIDTPRQLAMIESGELDIAIVRPRPSYPECASALVGARERLVIAASADWDHAGRQEIRPSDIVAETFIVPQFHEEVGLLEAVRDLAMSEGAAMPRVQLTEDFISAAALSAAGAGIVLAPKSLRRLALDNLTFIPLVGYEATIDLMVVMRDDAPIEAISAIKTEIGALAPGD